MNRIYASYLFVHLCILNRFTQKSRHGFANHSRESVTYALSGRCFVPRVRSSRKPTIRDVARRAGVALGTVSRVLNSHESVRMDSRTKVQRAIAELGYEHNMAASS